mmetsp:Transcript_12696/g.24742  ORF Transcript_12696/g.24742 Transcript_12696/m.24742 type:complete len:153 (-) Transcript_12696:52-510(-)
MKEREWGGGTSTEKAKTAFGPAGRSKEFAAFRLSFDPLHALLVVFHLSCAYVCVHARLLANLKQRRSCIRSPSIDGLGVPLQQSEFFFKIYPPFMPTHVDMFAFHLMRLHRNTRYHTRILPVKLTVNVTMRIDNDDVLWIDSGFLHRDRDRK